MLNLELDANDDPDFGRVVQDSILGALQASTPAETFVVKLDNWFGPRWLGFSHKALGALGVASSELRIPPFAPGRVLYERYFVRAGERNDYLSADAPFALHIRQTSSANAARRISLLCPHAALFWWSGSTNKTGRGAIMAYIPAATAHAFWYAELTKTTQWSSGAMRGITAQGLSAYRAVGAAAQRGDQPASV